MGTAGLSSFADLSEVDTLVTGEAQALLADHVGKLVIANVAARADRPAG